MKIGRPAYDLIRSALESGTLTVFQTRNALHALFRLRSHASEQEVFDIYVRFAQHADELIRSYAVQLGIGLLRLHRKYPLQPLTASEHDLDTFRHAAELGVEPHVAELVHSFFTT
jgi:hypothetical protein